MEFNVRRLAADAGTFLSRAVQFTEEKLGQAERTELDAHLETLLNRAESTKHWTEKIMKQTEVVLQPNPNVRMEDFLYEILDKKVPTRANNHELLGECMIDSGHEFGPGTAYGLDVEDLKQRTYKFFGPGSEYDTPLNDPYRDKGAPRPQLPIEGPWRQASLKSFIKNVDAGKAETGCETDNQMDGVAKLGPIVACYAGKPEMLERVEDTIRVTQNNDTCVAVTLAAARFLEHFILNGPDPKALDAVLEQLNDTNRKNPQELDKAIAGQIHQVKENLSKKPKELIPAVFSNT